MLLKGSSLIGCPLCRTVKRIMLSVAEGRMIDVDSLWAATLHRSHDQFHAKPLLIKNKEQTDKKQRRSMTEDRHKKAHLNKDSPHNRSSSWPTWKAAS